MSGFTSQQLEKRLGDLNSSAQTIQTFSLWLIHHRKHHKIIVQTWFKELKKANQSRKLTFMYLANDVIQNSRKKGPEFTKEFASALKPAFANVAREADEKTWKGLDRILSVWEERNIYDSNQIGELRKAISPKKGHKNGSTVKGDSENSSVKDDSEKGKKREKASIPASNDAKKLKTSHHHNKTSSSVTKISATNTNTVPNSNNNSKTNNIKKSLDKTEKSVKFGDDNKVIANESTTTATFPTKVVDPEQLISALQELENSASSDASVREKIASLPPEVSDPTLLKKIRDKDAAERLSRQVDEACIILAEYNSRLTQELEERKKIASILTAFVQNQKDSLTLAEQRLIEFKDKLRKVAQVRDELKSHLQNLPDLSLLPSISGGLAPLPSAGDLFSIAAAKSAMSAMSKSSMGSTSSASPNTASPADYGTPTSTGTPNSGIDEFYPRS